MKILFLTDTHIRANSPKSRKDDFYQAILGKLKWVGEYASSNNIDIIIHGGDWLNRPDISYSALKHIYSILNDWKVPIYTVLGNHDIYGYNPETFDRTALSLLVTLGVIKRLSKEPVIIDNVSLTGVDSHYRLDKNNDISDYVDVKGDDDKIKINVVHGFLARKDWPMVDCTLIQDILHTKADITLTGHEHGGYSIYSYGSKTFINPGSLARVSASAGDVNKDVKVAIIETDGLTFNTYLEYLPENVARPSEEVIDRQRLLEENANAKKLEDFAGQLQFLDGDDLDFYNALEKLCERDGVDRKVIKLAIAKLEEAEELIANEDKKEN